MATKANVESFVQNFRKQRITAHVAARWIKARDVILVMFGDQQAGGSENTQKQCSVRTMHRQPKVNHTTQSGASGYFAPIQNTELELGAHAKHPGHEYRTRMTAVPRREENRPGQRPTR